MKKATASMILFGLLVGLVFPLLSSAEELRIAIMQDQSGAAQKYRPLLDYLGKRGIDASLVAAKDYPTAAALFAGGGVDAMFSGSGIAGTMMIKELAVPEVRPVDKDGHSTYWAVIIAPKGSPKFTGSADSFNGKRLIFTSLASSGEFYYHSLPGAAKVKATLIKAASHGAALEALEKGQADVAIVKNRIWDEKKAKFPNLIVAGEDKGENPDGTLIVSRKANRAIAAKVTALLLALKDDTSPQARAVMDSLDIQGFIKTTPKDFEHTLSLLKNAGVTKAFNFAYE
jgi:ABC-type phosphate/phosphonate transport system substrate-binding protein